MTEAQRTPRVHIQNRRLDNGIPVALRDTPQVFDLAIDFTQDPDEIVGALQALFQEAVDEGRWARVPAQRRTAGAATA